MPYVVGRKVQPPDGTTVIFEVTGPAGRLLPIGVEGSRANPMDQAPTNPTISLTMDAETFARLGCGRLDPAEALETGRIRVQGDEALGERVVRQMNIMI